MNNLAEKERELQRKNQELEQKRKEIEAELKRLEEGGDDYLGEEGGIGSLEEDELEDENDDKVEVVDKEEESDIIGQIEGVRKIQEERNVERLKELKKIFESNRGGLQKNKEKLERLDNNLVAAETAYNIKCELKKDLESKGKKISEESKKWILDVSKLTDKYEEIANTLGNLEKEEESIRGQLNTAQKRLEEFKKEKLGFENEYKLISVKSEGLKEEIERAKQNLKDKEVYNKEQIQKQSKNMERAQINKKRVEKQKTELLKAYKKLNQHISLLRKANIHLEAAKNLNFPLKEYLQAIDKPDILI